MHGGPCQAWSSPREDRCGGVTCARPRGDAGAARWLRCLLCSFPRAWTHGSPSPILLGSTVPLSDRAAVLEPQWDLAHHGLHRDVRGVPWDQDPLRAVEIFLLHLLDQEEGERLGDPGVVGMCGHPALGPMGT